MALFSAGMRMAYRTRIPAQCLTKTGQVVNSPCPVSYDRKLFFHAFLFVIPYANASVSDPLFVVPLVVTSVSVRLAGCVPCASVASSFSRFLFAVESISLMRFNWFTSLAPGSKSIATTLDCGCEGIYSG